MSTELLIAMGALVVSIVSLVVTVLWNRNQTRVTTRLTHLPAIAQLELSLGDSPSAFKCHGITEADLRDAGVTARELAYLTSSFSLGRALDEALSPGERGPFPPGTYRYKMCQSETTIAAWPFIDILFDNHAFKDRIRATIDLVENRGDVIKTISAPHAQDRPAHTPVRPAD